MATTDLNSALDLSFLISFCGLASISSDNPLVFYSHQLLSSVEGAAPISGPPSPTLHTGPHAVAL